MGSSATKLAAAETELAETMTEPTTGVGGRSVDWTLPAADAGASPMAASSAPRPAENAILRHAAMVAAGAKPCRLPFASCPGWETTKAAAVLLAAVVAAEYKTNDHFVRRGFQWRCQQESRSPEANLKCDFN